MKKQKKQMIILAVVLVVLVAAYFILPNVVKEEEEETESYVVTAMAGDAVTQISFTNEGTEYTFVKEDDVWYSTEDRTLPISQETVDNLVDKAGNITSTTKIEGVTDFSQYGLDNPLHEVKLTANGTEHTIVMGDYNDITGEYYLYMKGESTVYTVESTVVTPFATTLEALVEEKEETTKEDATAEITTEAVAENETETDTEITEETVTEEEATEEAATESVQEMTE